jgi:hypothetical protein
MRENTAGRVFWIIWCLSWATVWLAVAVLVPHAYLAWLLTAGSAGAIAIPVGRTRLHPPPGQRY